MEKKKALAVLNKDPVFYMDMIVPIMRNTAEIIYTDDNTVLLKETKSQAYMLSDVEFEKGKELVSSLEDTQLYSVHNKEMAEYIKEFYGLSTVMEVNQAVYLKKDRLPVSNEIEIRLVDASHMEQICSYYKGADEDYTKGIIEAGLLYGGFVGEQLCGFIGYHEEGSIGLLEIFPEFRRKGYGTILESFMTNLTLDKGLVPFGQVKTGNVSSTGLQKKLGYEISEKKIYWIT